MFDKFKKSEVKDNDVVQKYLADKENVVETPVFSKTPFSLKNLKVGDLVGDFKVTVCEVRGPNKVLVWMERV